MNKQTVTKQQKRPGINENRSRLLAHLPVNEHRLDLAGISTAVLVGGEGTPVVLLHGPGETSVWWMRVIPQLVKTHQIIVPDLPGHGATKITGHTLNAAMIFPWLDKLIERTCPSRPVLVGHLLGGAIAARFAVDQKDKLSHLILVDSLGLGKFRPAPQFAFRLIRFLMRPSQKNYNRFLPQCIFNADNLSKHMGNHWEPFMAYNLESAQDPDSKNALRILMKHLGVPKIPSKDLAKIDLPTALVWGRHDRANRLQIAKDASKRYGWPLYVIDEARDDPKLERPEAFIHALYSALKDSEHN